MGQKQEIGTSLVVLKIKGGMDHLGQRAYSNAVNCNDSLDKNLQVLKGDCEGSFS